ncbi:MAG: hypothetical protein KJI69_02370 [Patescibacteria group bacterium]|nr:hypothetical protein [Patescibacteria group bacterium]
MTKKILIVDDSDDDSDAATVALRGIMGRDEISIIYANTILDAERKFFAPENQDIVGIIMDGHVSAGSTNAKDTPELVKEFRETFEGPIIASSSDSALAERLVEAGCDEAGDKGIGVARIMHKRLAT